MYSVTTEGMNEALKAPTFKCYKFVGAFRNLPSRPREDGTEGVQVERPGHIRLGGFQGGGLEWG